MQTVQSMPRMFVSKSARVDQCPGC